MMIVIIIITLYIIYVYMHTHAYRLWLEVIPSTLNGNIGYCDVRGYTCILSILKLFMELWLATFSCWDDIDINIYR